MIAVRTGTIRIYSGRNMMLGSSTTAPKLDRKSLPKENNLDAKTSVASRKISQTQNYNHLSTPRPRAGTWGKRERSTSTSSRDRDQDRNSSSGIVDHKYVPLENTYQLQPEVKFQVQKVEGIIANILQSELKDEKYDPLTSSRSCMLLSDTIKEKVKALNMRRYRIICCVIITEKAQQSMAIASRFCWDKENDNFACAQYNQPMLHAVGMVFGVYLD